MYRFIKASKWHRYVTYVAIFIVSLSSFSASSSTCTSLFRVENPSRQAEFIDNLFTNPNLREQILARKAKEGNLEFQFPEFIPTLEQMVLELNSAINRLESMETSLLKHILSKKFFILREMKGLKKEIQLSSKNITYKSAIEISYKFSWYMREMARMDGAYIDYLFSTKSQITESVNMVLQLSTIGNIIYLPTFSNIDIPQLNRLWAIGILPLGLTPAPVNYDGIVRGTPDAFIVHDNQHARDYIRSLILGYTIEPNTRTNKFNNPDSKIFNLRQQELIKTEVFLYKNLDRYPLIQGTINFNGGTTTRAVVEMVLFSYRHEANDLPITLYSSSAYREDGFIRASDYTYQRIKSENAINERSGYPKDPFIEAYLKEFSLESESIARQWILDQWKKSNSNPFMH